MSEEIKVFESIFQVLDGSVIIVVHMPQCFIPIFVSKTRNVTVTGEYESPKSLYVRIAFLPDSKRVHMCQLLS